MTVCYWEKPWRSVNVHHGSLWALIWCTDDVMDATLKSTHWMFCSRGHFGSRPLTLLHAKLSDPVYQLKFTQNELIFIGELLVVLLRALGKIISLQYQITHCDDEFIDLRVILSPFVIFNAVLFCFQPSWHFLLKLVWISGIVCASECLCSYAL